MDWYVKNKIKKLSLSIVSYRLSMEVSTRYYKVQTFEIIVLLFDYQQNILIDNSQIDNKQNYYNI